MFHRPGLDGWAVGVVGGGEPEGVLQGGPGNGVEFPVEDPGAVGESAEVEPVAGFGRFGLDQGVGVATPRAITDSTWRTGSGIRVGISSGSCSANNPMVVGESWETMASICPPDGLTSAVGGGGHRQLAQASGVAYEAGGVAEGPPGESDEPGFLHRAGPIQRP